MRSIVPAALWYFALAVLPMPAAPLKVFILAGQSNMDGQADQRTIDFLAEDPDPARAALLKIFKPDGKSFMTRGDVWVTSGDVSGDLGPGYGGRKDYSKRGRCIGPEYSFGHFMGEALAEQVLLIKFAPGGQSLYKNFRPPGAGLPDPMPMKPGPNKTKTPMTAEDFGGQYRALVAHVRDVLANLKHRFPTYDEAGGYQIVGLVWFHGYNDMVEGGAAVAEYAANLSHLIKDLRRDLKAPEMKGVIGVMGVNGIDNEDGKQGAIRRQMRSFNDMPEFRGQVQAVETAPLLSPAVVALKTAGWLNQQRDLNQQPLTPDEQAMLGRATSSQGFHYYGEGRFFILLGKRFAEAMLELTRGKPD